MIIFSALVLTGSNLYAEKVDAEPVTQIAAVSKVGEEQYVSACAIVNSPKSYLNKTVCIKAKFDKFSTLGLDYSKAMRKSGEYIGILIQRDDVVDHNIPLSEMKLFMKKDMASYDDLGKVAKSAYILEK